MNLAAVRYFWFFGTIFEGSVCDRICFRFKFQMSSIIESKAKAVYVVVAFDGQDHSHRDLSASSTSWLWKLIASLLFVVNFNYFGTLLID